jgi:hypothetical protein
LANISERQASYAVVTRSLNMVSHIIWTTQTAFKDSVSSQMQPLKILSRKSLCQWVKSESIYEGSILQSDISRKNEAASALRGVRIGETSFNET